MQNLPLLCLLLVPPKVREPMLTILNETAVMLAWSPPVNPNGILIEYQVIYYSYDSLQDTQKSQVSSHNF